jgi:hypothetical protein
MRNEPEIINTGMLCERKNLTNMIMDTWLLPSPLLHNHHSRLTLPLSSIFPKTSAEVYNAQMLNHKQKNMTSMASVPCFLENPKLRSWDEKGCDGRE